LTSANVCIRKRQPYYPYGPANYIIWTKGDVLDIFNGRLCRLSWLTLATLPRFPVSLRVEDGETFAAVVIALTQSQAEVDHPLDPRWDDLAEKALREDQRFERMPLGKELAIAAIVVALILLRNLPDTPSNTRSPTSGW
jgi:hypothetical protein